MGNTECAHTWKEFWDTSRCCERCELVEQREPHPPLPAPAPRGDGLNEAQHWLADLKAAREAPPLTDGDIDALERRLGWSERHTLTDHDARRLLRALRAERSAEVTVRMSLKQATSIGLFAWLKAMGYEPADGRVH
jgi:hypothetical protein